MDDATFLDSAIQLIKRPLEELWQVCEQPRALYARGSAILPIEPLVHPPWDMDFVLFVAANEVLAARMAAVAMTKIRISAPNLPPPDISIACADSSPKSLYTLLLVSVNGRLLFGEDCRLPTTCFSKNYHAIWQHAAEISVSRLISFKRCPNPVEQQKRAPHLAKSVLRLGGLLKLQEGDFTRSPEECATLLNKTYPLLQGSSAVLLRSLEDALEPKVLAEACHHILQVINGGFHE